MKDIPFQHTVTLTKNFLIKNPDGSYDTNLHGEFFIIYSDNLLYPKRGNEALRLRIKTTPMHFPLTDAMWDKFMDSLPALVRKHIDHATVVSSLPKEAVEVDLSSL